MRKAARAPAPSGFPPIYRLKNFEIFAEEFFKFARSGRRRTDFKRGVAREFRFHDDGIAQHVAGDARDEPRVRTIETFRDPKKHAEFFHRVEIFFRYEIFIFLPFRKVDVFFFVTTGNERRKHDFSN